MKSLEFARNTSKYIGNTAKEISGIGPAQRAYRRTMLAQKDVYDKLTVFNSSLCNGAANGIQRIIFPFLHKSSGGSGHQVGDIGKGGMDLIVDLTTLWWAHFGNYEESAYLKLGYNTLVQIAPDVAKLAKEQLFQRAK